MHDPESWDGLSSKKDGAKAGASAAHIVAQVEAAPSKDAQIQENLGRISALMQELRTPHGHGEAMGTLSILHETLADCHLRTRGLPSASGAGIPRALKAADADFAQRWHRAFTAAFMGDRRGVLQLVEEELAPFGGPLCNEHGRSVQDA